MVGDENVCVQSLFYIDKSGVNIFICDADWVFINLCTTGHVHLSRWSVGAHSDRGQTKTTLDIEWYARLVRRYPLDETVTFSLMNGTITFFDYILVL